MLGLLSRRDSFWPLVGGMWNYYTLFLLITSYPSICLLLIITPYISIIYFRFFPIFLLLFPFLLN